MDRNDDSQGLDISSDDRVLDVPVSSELQRSYLSYAMSVIVSRALPDVRDGLKPVHRRSLYAMHRLRNRHNEPYKKSARIVGDVIGKYHPHGDGAVYDAIVRMAQPFSLRYPLVDGQGNFGSLDGDEPAAMRYTEVRMTRLAGELMLDLDSNSVDFSPNYDGDELIPDVLPTRIPQLLVNGAAGIAVGMATSIPPHNLREVLAGSRALLFNSELTDDELFSIIPGPDFPTGGIINGVESVHEGYRTGRGRVRLRSRADIEELPGNRAQIVVTEIPYGTNKARLVSSIAAMVREKKLEGVSDIQDQSDKDGVRVVIYVSRDAQPEVVLNSLYKSTSLEITVSCNFVALVDGLPKQLGLRDMLEHWLEHRREVVTRRSRFELEEAKARAQLLEGRLIALANIDPVVETIKSSRSRAEAEEKLVDRLWDGSHVTGYIERAGLAIETGGEYGFQLDDGSESHSYRLSPEQAASICELRLHSLTGMEQEKVAAELGELLDIRKRLEVLLSDPTVLRAKIAEEIDEMEERYGDDRVSEIQRDHLDLQRSDLIPRGHRVVVISHSDYAKSQSVEEFRSQRRGGTGRIGADFKTDDLVKTSLLTHSHSQLMFVTDLGRAYWKHVYDLPPGSHKSRGKPLINLLQVQEGEKVSAVLPIAEDNVEVGAESTDYLVFATAQGMIKRTPVSEFIARSTGKIAINLDESDRVIGVLRTDGRHQIVLVTSKGKAIRFDQDDVRSMGRVARGVKGIRLTEGDEVVSVLLFDPEDGKRVLLVADDGHGKRIDPEEIRQTGRYAQGVMVLPSSSSSQQVRILAASAVDENDEIIAMTDRGMLLRTSVDQVRLIGRRSRGVRVMRVREGERLTQVTTGYAAVPEETTGETPDEPAAGDEAENDES